MFVQRLKHATFFYVYSYPVRNREGNPRLMIESIFDYFLIKLLVSLPLGVVNLII
jgi:hypothetical protein